MHVKDEENHNRDAIPRSESRVARRTVDMCGFRPLGSTI